MGQMGVSLDADGNSTALNELWDIKLPENLIEKKS